MAGACFRAESASPSDTSITLTSLPQGQRYVHA
jgi:hypothetical protein